MVVNTSRLEEGASDIHAQSLRIAQIGEELEKISGELDTGGGMDAIRLRLRRTSERLETDARKANVLSDLLVRVSDRYACTEQNIANAETEIFPAASAREQLTQAIRSLLEDKQAPELEKNRKNNRQLFEAVKKWIETAGIQPTVIEENFPMWFKETIKQRFGKADNGDDVK